MVSSLFVIVLRRLDPLKSSQTNTNLEVAMGATGPAS